MRFPARLTLALALGLGPACAQAMSFVAEPPWLFLSGRVVAEDRKTWNEAMARFGDRIRTVVFFNSPGGLTASGRFIGAEIRARGFTTVVTGRCVSACTTMFLGGEKRQFATSMNEWPTWLAFHGTYGRNGKLRRDADREYHLAMSGGRLSPEVVERFSSLENRRGLLYFTHPLQREAGPAPLAILCQGDEDRARRESECERLETVDALSQGIVTTWDTVTIPPLPRFRRDSASQGNW